MQKQILVPIDYTDISKDAIKLADAWAQRNQNKICFLHSAQKGNYPDELPVPEAPFFYHETDSKDIKAHHNQLLEFLEYQNITSDYQTLYGYGKPYLQILAAEKKLDADMILMAAHSHTALGRLLMGSNTDYVSHHSRCPLYVYKHSKTEFSKRILLPVDYTDINKPVIKLADEWAQRTGDELILFHVTLADEGVSSVEYDYEISGNDNYLEQYAESLSIKSNYRTISVGGVKSYVEILKAQKHLKTRLIMMASHPHTAAERFLTGSNTDYLLHHADCPMYVYKMIYTPNN